MAQLHPNSKTKHSKDYETGLKGLEGKLNLAVPKDATPNTGQLNQQMCLSPAGELSRLGSSAQHSWSTCYYCPCETFKSSADFVRHLRERHCTREGGSYVCRYGFNGVCPSLPLDGVSDRDYDAHVSKYHVNQQTRGLPPEWSVFSAAQNLPAVLNDPLRGKQSNLFTKNWGDSFVEKAHITPSTRLPEVTPSDFEKYIAKIGKRYRRHERLHPHRDSVVSPVSSISSVVGSLPITNSNKKPSSPTHELSLSRIPEIFLNENFDLNQASTYSLVFPSGIGCSPNEENKQSGRLLQEQLSHYLDIVEVKIAKQVSQKSAAFFHAMTSQDAIMHEMQEATQNVRDLRKSLKNLKKSVVEDSFRVMRYALRRQNYEELLDKLSLMATVHKTQPMLQLLLGTQDYVAALDLIGTTQEILTQELIGVHCFKHLPMQLTEMEKLIDKMLTTEFERYATADLNRPLSDVLNETDSVCAEEDKMVCVVMGLLRKKNFSFVDTYKNEVILTIRAIIKQLVIEVIASSDAEICLTGDGEEAQSLSIAEWIMLLKRATVALLTVLLRVKAVCGIMRQTTDAASGCSGQLTADEMQTNSDRKQEPTVSLIDFETFLTVKDRESVQEKLKQMLITVCNYCHERCANLVSTQSLERSIATAEEVYQLTTIVDDFCTSCESICGVVSVPLKFVIEVQASRFASRFHSDRKQKLALLLDSERWRQVDIPSEFQKIINRMVNMNFATCKFTHDMPLNCEINGDESNDNSLATAGSKTSPVLLIDGTPYALVGVVLLLVQMINEYCRCALGLPIVTRYFAHNVIDLLRTFNSRSCQLIIGAGAMRVAGLKTITSTNLALVSRALQLIVCLLPKIKKHFQNLDAPQIISGYESIERDYLGHIKEIENKIFGIVSERIAAQLEQWDARAPIPSQCFRNISRHLMKLHEAVAPILPEVQVHRIYGTVHRNFKDKLREQLIKLNVMNNHGPQHGIVTSELTFYMETLRTLKALKSEELDDSILEDIWSFLQT